MSETPVLEDQTLYKETRSPNYYGGLIDHMESSRNTERANRSTVMSERESHQDLSSRPHTHLNNSIHIINKDLRHEFQGMANASTVARIKWFENGKSQILGFCACLALLGITIALFEWRWSGLVAGSVLTIISGSSVVWTYHTKKSWHKHPNPIVHMRSVLSIFFAICLLFNVIVNFGTGSDTDTCTTLSGFTEFFVITSEAWGLIMACDLFNSLMSPFTSYKRLMRFYHLTVWSLGIIFSLVMWYANGAAGFFRVDGRRIEENDDSSYLIGFCLASSQLCCKVETETCMKCTTSNFLSAQKWPWLLVYSFVIFVVLASVMVLMLAWHRLYLRGVPKTYNIRLRVLNYISFFTGAYIFYWLLLLVLYMCAYFLSSKDDGAKNKSVAAQVLRQIVLFLIASKGYLDFVIWFAVNSIGWHGKGNQGSRSRSGSGSHDVDVDLNPQVNTALRSEVLYYTTSGIKQSVKEVSGMPPGRSQQEVFLLSTGDPNERHDKKIKFWSYCPTTFRCIREIFGLKDEEYAQLFSATTKERFSEGRSGAFMFFTSDERLIVKTMSKEECTLLRKMAPDYATFLLRNPKSLLTRFYGCHAVSLYGKMYYFVVMGNLFADTQIIHHRYDIKGSWEDRNAKLPKSGDKVHCRYCNASYTFGGKRNQECGNGFDFHEPNIVLKDNDLYTKIRIDPMQAETVHDQLCADSEFLCSQGVMDYSLLMGVHTCEYFVEPANLMTHPLDDDNDDQPGTPGTPRRQESISFRTKFATSVNGPALYHFGIIDFLQTWTYEKKFERFYKTTFRRRNPDGISALPPKPYKVRFHQKMAQIFNVNPVRPGRLSREEFAESTYHQPGLLDVVDKMNQFNARTGVLTPDESSRNTAVATPLLA